MTSRMRITLGLTFLLACGRPTGAANVWGRVLERGGELADVQHQDTSVTVSQRTVTVWGVMEVPDGSRLQAAYAGVDAVARSEFLKLVRVRIADVMVSVESTDKARNDAHEHTVEVVGGVLRHAGTPRHGWERVQRDERIILRVWSRLAVPRVEFDSALATASTAADLDLPANFLDELARDDTDVASLRSADTPPASKQ